MLWEEGSNYIMNFKEKTVVITGAAVGIGRACALQFAKYGADVVLVDNNSETLDATYREVKSITDRCYAFQCDVSDNDAVLETVKLSAVKFNKIDILVNNAAIWRDFSSFVEADIDLWKKYMNINVMGTVYFTKAVIDKMIENRYGRIINVASVAGVYGNANMAHYSATKGAVISFTKALAKEVATYGITVNAVSPGSVTPADNFDIEYHKPSELSFIGRTGTAKENAELICFLASDEAAYISGQNIQIDGCRKKM